MDYSEFMKKAIEYDGRNKFEKYDGDIQAIPADLRPFYSECNPIDVELSYEGSAVKFYPVTELGLLRSDYPRLQSGFVFATYNGDPVFYDEGKVFICAHGAHESNREPLFDNIESFFSALTSQ